MNWKMFFKLMLRNLVLVPLGAAAVLGLLGFWAGGREGFLNGATWGFVLGLISVPMTGLTLMINYFGDFSSRFGAYFNREDTENQKTLD